MTESLAGKGITRAGPTAGPAGAGGGNRSGDAGVRVVITIALLTLWEIALAILPDTQLPGEAIAGLLAICLWMIVGGSLIDVRSGFLGRLAFVFGLAWYISSIGRWAASVDTIYILAGPDGFRPGPSRGNRVPRHYAVSGHDAGRHIIKG